VLHGERRGRHDTCVRYATWRGVEGAHLVEEVVAQVEAGQRREKPEARGEHLRQAPAVRRGMRMGTRRRP
jgi:hypothetical protein